MSPKILLVTAENDGKLETRLKKLLGDVAVEHTAEDGFNYAQMHALDIRAAIFEFPLPELSPERVATEFQKLRVLAAVKLILALPNAFESNRTAKTLEDDGALIFSSQAFLAMLPDLLPRIVG